jgi:hypothetical protein
MFQKCCHLSHKYTTVSSHGQHKNHFSLLLCFEKVWSFSTLAAEVVVVVAVVVVVVIVTVVVVVVVLVVLASNFTLLQPLSSLSSSLLDFRLDLKVSSRIA